ncbi:hypothetical protein PR003_g31968 [Phytophthora rubi]|uniref:Uncharacterized protein n=1 Tax=Phytophthora rubi TaxID=129364 RepID=A0A6A4B5W4_9STRA|nr:hypothetical protein PR003_g31968 [Phytophthora rubi]
MADPVVGFGEVEKLSHSGLTEDSEASGGEESG